MTNPNYVGAAEPTLHTIEDHLLILANHHPTGRDRMIVKPDLSSQAV
jgi:hypothetical protein